MYCAQCGTSNAESSHFCVKCGSALVRRPADLVPRETPQLGPLLNDVPSAGSTALYAGFWRRVGAYFIDFIIVFVAHFLMGLAVILPNLSETTVDVTLAILLLLLIWLYQAVLESGPQQATFGKQIVGIKVTNLAGQRISFARASGRCFAEWITCITLGIGYVMAAFTQRRQSLHDMIASTVVVHPSVDRSHVTGRPAAKPIPAGTIVPSAMGIAPYAAFWRRAGALLIDEFILLVAFWSLAFAASLMGLPERNIAAIAFLVIFLPGPWLYSATLESGARQATIGKRIVGIKVTDLEGQRISFARASGRYFAEWITSITLGVGYVMAAFTQRRQSLHDMIARTVVVHSNVEPSNVAYSPIAKPIPAWAIVLIVLASMISMLGIIAVNAIPAYEDYTIRTQIAEGLTQAAEFKAGVAEHAAQTGNWPADLVEAGLGSAAAAADKAGRYVESIDVSNGTIQITYGRDANSLIMGLQLGIRPLVNENGDVVWQCGNSNQPPNTHVNSGGASGGGTNSDAGTTDLRDKYIPASCRSSDDAIWVQ